MAGDEQDRRTDHAVRLGRVIRQLRTDRKMTQDAVPGVYPYWVSEIETGKRNPSWESLERLLQGLGVTAEEFGRAWDQAS